MMTVFIARQRVKYVMAIIKGRIEAGKRAWVWLWFNDYKGAYLVFF